MKVDWKIDMGGIITILIAAGSLIYGYGALGNRTEEVERKVSQMATVNERLAKLETQINFLVDDARKERAAR